MAAEEQIIFRSDIVVELIDQMGDDQAVVDAARVSFNNAGETDEKRNSGLIKALMRDQHGSPFEQVIFKFRLEIPLKVARELHRHRIASYNEWSSRYSRMLPHFWVPRETRKLKQVGKPMEYRFEAGSGAQHAAALELMKLSYERAWHSYTQMLTVGIAKEVAAYVLPVSTYTSMYMVINARALMNLLQLRIDHPNNKYPTHPLAEIQEMAEEMEHHFHLICPMVWKAFNLSGRVAP